MISHLLVPYYQLIQESLQYGIHYAIHYVIHYVILAFQRYSEFHYISRGIPPIK